MKVFLGGFGRADGLYIYFSGLFVVVVGGGNFLNCGLNPTVQIFFILNI